MTSFSDSSEGQAVNDEMVAALQRLNTVIDSIDDLIWVCSPDDFHIIWANKASEDYITSTWGVETSIGFSLHQLNNPLAESTLREIYATVLREGRFSKLCHHLIKDKVLLLTVNLIQSQNRISGICVFARDFTDQYQAEIKLAEKESRYRSVINSMVEGVVFQSHTGEIIEVNPAALAIEGRNSDQMQGKTSDAPEWGAIREDGSPFPGDEHPSMVTLKTGQVLRDVVMGIRRPSGELRWITINTAPVYNDDNNAGHVREVVATFHDITEQKARETELKVSATAFDRSQEAMMITDPRQKILKINEAFTTLTGYTPEEVIGKTPSILSSGKHDHVFYEKMWESLLANRYWQGEIWNVRKNGELYPEWLSITAVLDRDGKVINYVGAFTDLTLQKKAEKQINDLLFYDALTGLANRRLLSSLLLQTLQRDQVAKRGTAVLFINLDQFKSINERFGHIAGDSVLQQLAKRFRMQSKGGDFFARLGNDEFAMILGDLPLGSEKAAIAAEAQAHAIHGIVSKPVDVNQLTLHLTCCVGIGLSVDGTMSSDELLRRTDIAMFQAKQKGPNQIHFFDEYMQSQMEQKINLRERLSQAIPSQLQLHYQMQADEHGRCYGAEALVRWIDPVRGTVSPAQFIPLAEESDLIFPIGRWVLETACQQIKRWDKQPQLEHLILSINVSAREFSREDFVDDVLGLIASSGINPGRLCIEITESMLLHDAETAVSKMSVLRQAGVLFSLDDFGTGYSSLSYLKRLPLSELKIDQSFLHGIESNANDLAIVNTIIALGKTLGLSVIAEGVETESQRQTLIKLGCTRFQGYLIAKPVPVNEFEAVVCSAL